MRGAAFAVAAALMLAMASGTTLAVTLMVNGDTPSVRYQRWADGFAGHVPVPAGIIDLYLSGCPYDRGADGCASAASSPGDGRLTIFLRPRGLDPSQLRQALAHEMGHLVIDLSPTPLFDDWDRARFAALWHRPQIDWWAALRACDPVQPTGFSADPRGGADCGEQSEAAEWAADAYALCATGYWRLGYDDIDLNYLPDFGLRDDGNTVSDMRRTRAPIVATCGLIRSAASDRGAGVA